MYFADVLTDKCAENVEVKHISSIISRWLSGAPDREGGRKLRLSQSLAR